MTSPSPAQTRADASADRESGHGFPKDRFDGLERGHGRSGAHRAEHPRLRVGAIVVWSAVATVVLILAGVFGTMLATGRLDFAPAPAATEGAGPVAPMVDTSYPVLILNATDQAGLAAELRDVVVEAGWAEGDVQESNASSTDFETTTVYYPSEADEAAARGLADVIGGAEVSLDDTYQVVGDPSTPGVDGELGAQLVIVVGLDHRTE
ncbi:LytR C-terminal domain-containing protein [Microbacterium dauci]|uniref:LytR C-terminal domain-containing protein n=1 Tax=Microbacterium dauci TaxID=3048008 RepID=A0ABT6ZBL7_9MICO|nr:LytR C-terminal domain-containing protein [Microbacterium sp. LX3-4]MDJ1113085.1 LytR C-terminal domain-containing protein [Microbacterium sp. LX3-4]